MPNLKIVSIHCRRKSEGGSTDNIYLRTGGAKVWGDHEISLNETVQVNYSIPIERDLTVELMEQDNVSPDDLLGSITVNRDSLGKHKSEANGDGGAYDINFEVTP